VDEGKKGNRKKQFTWKRGEWGRGGGGVRFLNLFISLNNYYYYKYINIAEKKEKKHKGLRSMFEGGD